MLKLQTYLPSALTLANLCAGTIAILSDNPFTGLICILIACLLDIFDGLTARWLHASSEFGKQLDSLADIVSFGLAPAVLMHHYLLQDNTISLVIVCLIPVFSAIRLAKFNIDQTQKTVFKGLPTPANGLFFASLPWIAEHYFTDIRFPALWMYLLILFFSLMMIIPLRMFSFKSLRTPGFNRVIPLLFIVCFIILLIFSGWLAIPLSILAYIILSIPFHLLYTSQNT